MENLSNFDVQELDANQLQEVQGGWLALAMAALSLCIAAYGAGYVTGKAIF